MDKKSALIAGATGLVGRELLRLLLDQEYYDRIVVLTRRELDIKDNRLENSL
ncbi:MAG: NAD-dependent epimerase/dehydratase family protein, partial [Bacteroidota bacterium]